METACPQAARDAMSVLNGLRAGCLQGIGKAVWPNSIVKSQWRGELCEPGGRIGLASQSSALQTKMIRGGVNLRCKNFSDSR